VSKGAGALFGAILSAMTSGCSDAKRRAKLSELSSMGQWDYSKTIKSPALYVGLRAWIISSFHKAEHSSIGYEVEGWLSEPWNYYTRTTWLYDRFIGDLRKYFRDPRANWQFYRRGVDTFIFKSSDYRQSWDALADLHLLSELSGQKGLIILVDEFEDVIYGLRNIKFQQDAFWNLFRLFDGEFPGLCFFAVTPSFVEKCKYLLMRKVSLDYDFSRFDKLPKFVMSPLQTFELEELAMKIMEAHGIAYDWEPDLVMKASHLKSIVGKAASLQVQDRARHAIITVVKALDDLLQESE
jgi:hypothetical protein